MGNITKNIFKQPLEIIFNLQEWLAEAEAVEEVQIMEELPHSLRREIAWNINKKIFKQLAIFHDFPHNEQVTICGMMTPIQVPTLAPNPLTLYYLITC